MNRIFFGLLIVLSNSFPAIAAQLVGWGDAQRPYRVAVTVPKEKQPRERAFIVLPLDFAADLARLGIRDAVDPQSLRFVRNGDVPCQVRDGRVEWADGPIPAGEERTYQLYFGTDLQRAPAASVGNLRIPDFATDTFGKAWDFDDGGFAGITSWGNRLEFIRHKVEDGVLKLDVEQDPYFIWGTMWGAESPKRAPLRLNVDRYSTLEMRVRQNVAGAMWALYGRPVGRDSLLHYEFTVKGTNWQTVRVDLRREANWHDTLSAFRIGPAKLVKAHIEIDWIRLTPLQQATRGAVEMLGAPSKPAASVTLALTDPQPRAGSTQTVKVRVADADGKPVSGQPVLLALAIRSGGVLDKEPGKTSLGVNDQARRALTDGTGEVVFRYRVSRRAGAEADRLEATAEFSAAPAAKVVVPVQSGPPHHYVVEPVRPRVLRVDDPPLAVKATLADEFDNPLPLGDRAVKWSASGGKLLSVKGTSAMFHGDPSRQWVGRLAVKDADGLTGESAPISTLPAGPRPNRVRLIANGYFAADGKPWLPLGGFYANWVGLPTEDGEWDKRLSFTDASDEQIVAWLKFLKANGVTAQRFMLRTHRKNGMEPMDIGGRVNPGLFAAFLHYLDLARPFGFKFLLVLHEDYTKPCYFNRSALEQWCLPWFAGEDLGALPAFQRRFIRDGDLIGDIADKYADAGVLACQDRYARELIGVVKNHPLVFGYELENEMVNCPASWANHAMETVRAADPGTPLCVSHGGGGLHTADPTWWKAKTTIDFYTYHIYPHGTTSLEMDYGLAIDVLTRYGRMGKPAFLGESAGDQFSYGPDRETRRWTMRDIIWFSLCNGNPGCFFWNARGSELAEFRLANEIASRVNWATFERKRPAIAIRVPHPLDDDKWFRSPGGVAANAMMGRYAQHYLDRGVNFDFALDDAADYPRRASVERFAPPEPASTDFAITPGYQLASLVRADNSEALVYLRNFAGVKLWETVKPNPWKQWLRERKLAAARVTVNLSGKFNADIWDLDTGKHEHRRVAHSESLDLGTSEHDFVVLLRR
ncbi:MAG: hypothetical protein NTY01_24965 [Verrucomicrobia bacterium]|nr:hypothetical protein [Verrucomicrobiota bacterium]